MRKWIETDFFLFLIWVCLYYCRYWCIPICNVASLCIIQRSKYKHSSKHGISKLSQKLSIFLQHTKRRKKIISPIIQSTVEKNHKSETNSNSNNTKKRDNNDLTLCVVRAKLTWMKDKAWRERTEGREHERVIGPGGEYVWLYYTTCQKSIYLQ